MTSGDRVHQVHQPSPDVALAAPTPTVRHASAPRVQAPLTVGAVTLKSSFPPADLKPPT